MWIPFVESIVIRFVWKNGNWLCCWGSFATAWFYLWRSRAGWPRFYQGFFSTNATEAFAITVSPFLFYTTLWSALSFGLFLVKIARFCQRFAPERRKADFARWEIPTKQHRFWWHPPTFRVGATEEPTLLLLVEGGFPQKKNSLLMGPINFLGGIAFLRFAPRKSQLLYRPTLRPIRVWEWAEIIVWAGDSTPGPFHFFRRSTRIDQRSFRIVVDVS